MSRSVLIWALICTVYSVMAGGCSVEGEVEAVDTAVPVPTEADSQASAGGLAPDRGSDAALL